MGLACQDTQKIELSFCTGEFMDSRFANLFGLTEEQAIALLDTPLDQLAEDDSRYVAAAQLVNFPSENSIQALIRAVQNTDPSLDNRIVRRKAVESLGKLNARQALPIIQSCLSGDDLYTVENAVWAIADIGIDDPAVLEEIAELLDKPGQSYRVIIQALVKLNYQPALARIQTFVEHTDDQLASAAIAAACRFTNDASLMPRVVELLQNKTVFTRRLVIQDLMDARYFSAIPQIARCPVSMVFRLRGIRALAEFAIPTGHLSFADIASDLDGVVRDHPQTLALVHQYDQPPTLERLIQELYETDFGRCYLATQTILETYPQEAPEALLENFHAEGYNDYGAHYHILKLLGWLRYQPAYELIFQNLNHPQPQFQKSRVAAAIALGELGNPDAIPGLQECLNSPIFNLQYSALLALEKLGDLRRSEVLISSENLLLQAKFKSLHI